MGVLFKKSGCYATLIKHCNLRSPADKFMILQFRYQSVGIFYSVPIGVLCVLNNLNELKCSYLWPKQWQNISNMIDKC